MKGYKAFSKGLVCRGKQYAENTVFEEKEAKICEKGMHFCKDPLDVMDYYPLVNDCGEISDFAEVEALEEPLTDNGKKFCTKKLRIGAKIDFARLVQASVSIDYESSEKIIEKTNSNVEKQDSAQIGSSGDCAQIGSSGYSAKIESTGKYSVICCAGNGSSARGKIGSWITLSEWRYDEDEKSAIPVCVKTEMVDGTKIKEDTFYKLVDGEFVEV